MNEAVVYENFVYLKYEASKVSIRKFYIFIFRKVKAEQYVAQFNKQTLNIIEILNFFSKLYFKL